MIDQHTFAEIAASLSALDLTAHNEQIADLEKEVARMRQVIATSEARCSEINLKVEELRHPELQRSDVADALLADVDPSEAAALNRQRDRLIEEQVSLRHGISEIGLRIRAAEQEINNVKRGARLKAREALQPLVDALTKQAQEAAKRILDVYGSMQAIVTATRYGGVEVLKVRRVVDDGIFADEQLLPRTTPFGPSSEVVDLLNRLDGKGAAFPFHKQVAPALHS